VPYSGEAHNEKLVGQLLVFLGHSVRRRLREHADGTEDAQAGGNSDENSPGDLGAGTRGVDSTGTVSTECDEVSY
jgi:hypothetical protein